LKNAHFSPKFFLNPNISLWGQYYVLKKLKTGAFDSNYSYLGRKVIKTLVFKRTPFFGRKLAKIAQNCDHNVGPMWGVF
jgi:hypothetical protein